MRVGIFTDDFYPLTGGQGRHIKDLYNKLYKKKDFLIFSPNENNLINHKTIFKFSRKFGKNLFLSFLINKNINEIIQENNIDIVHFHCGPGGLILIKKPSVKLICTVHHTYYQQQKYIPFQKWKYLLYLLERKMYHNADKIITVSESTKEVLVKNYNVSPEKIVVIYNGVNFKIFKKIKSIKKIPNSLLYVGRLDKRKGIDFLVKSIPLVKNEIPDIKLFIIGKGKSREKLEKFVEENNLEDNIKFLGFVPDDELPKWYNQCKLTIVPSVFEGFGITVIESLACGTPVVGTNTDGIKDIIKDKNMLVKFGDKEDLAKKIVKLLENNQIKFNFKKNNYNLDRIAKETLEVYRI